MKKAVMFLFLAVLLSHPLMVAAAESVQDSKVEMPANQDATTVGETGFLGENFSLMVGFKIWRATMNWEYSADTLTDSSANMYGPAVNLTIKEKFYAGASYYRGSGFEDTYSSYSENEGNTDFMFDTTKTDLDLWAGYSFHPRGSVFLGYKNTIIELEIDAPMGGGWLDATFTGPVLGLAGNYPIGDSGFIVFGTIGYAFLDASIESSAGDSSSCEYAGPAVEFGVSYILSFLPKLSLTGGFKYQNYTAESDEGTDEITFSGFTFGANYRF